MVQAYSAKLKQKVDFKHFCIVVKGGRLRLMGTDENGNKLNTFGSKNKLEEYKADSAWNGVYIDENTKVVEEEKDD